MNMKKILKHCLNKTKLCKLREHITVELVVHAKTMKSMSKNKSSHLTVKKTVIITVHCDYRGKTYVNYILGVLLSIIEDGFDKMGTKKRILKLVLELVM